jgi:hypothetical protein
MTAVPDVAKDVYSAAVMKCSTVGAETLAAAAVKPWATPPPKNHPKTLGFCDFLPVRVL